MTRTVPTRDVELALVRDFGAPVVGIDEVGRGAIAGPVAVGACAVFGTEAQVPAGLADSKMLTPKRREKLVPAVREWVSAYSVGWASNAEIDQWGIVAGLRLAGMRALEAITSRVGAPRVVLLDGSHNWLTPPQDLFAQFDGPQLPDVAVPPVVTQVKADASCAVVAAASVLAKVERDAYMATLSDPGYDWASNKGYASSAHTAALSKLGLSEMHRRSWRLLGASR